MKKLVFVPIELLEERYSLQWYSWFQQAFRGKPYEVITILPESGKHAQIQQGEFLDVIGTNRFKAEQLVILCDYIQQGIIDRDTTILFMDAWFPGLEMLAYMRDGLGVPFKLVGLFHAGTWDDHDFLTRSGMRNWAQHVERSWFLTLDAICVATQFHKDLILKATKLLLHDKIHVTGFPVYNEFYNTATKENLIVFPHRIAPEKQPQLFDQLVVHPKFKRLGMTAVKTKDVISSKKEYYSLLNQAKVAVSFALQETFGIAMIEAVLCGCYPIVPDRLSYTELYPAFFKYMENKEGAVESVIQRLTLLLQFEKFFKAELLESQSRLTNRLLQLGQWAIPNILSICKGVHHD